MKPLRYLSAKRAMCAVMFIAMPLLAYGGGPPFKSTLIPCDMSCGGFVGLAGTEAFGDGDFLNPEPATLEGLAGVGATGVLKVQVKGATADTTYEVFVGNLDLGPMQLPNPLITDSNGDGSVNNLLLPGRHISGVFLMRDTEQPVPDGLLEPRIQTGFVIP